MIKSIILALLTAVGGYFAWRLNRDDPKNQAAKERLKIKNELSKLIEERDKLIYEQMHETDLVRKDALGRRLHALTVRVASLRVSLQDSHRDP